MSRSPRPKLDLLEAVEGHYASQVILALNDFGILQLLVTPCEAPSIATVYGLDPLLLERLLEFVSRTTDVVVRDGFGRYQLGRTQAREIAFQIGKFIGAYGESIAGLRAALTNRRRRPIVNDAALVAAFAAAGAVPSQVAPILRDRGYRRLLDLGCGPASLGIKLALADERFTAVGVDSSAGMCRLARSAIREAGVARRVRIHCADVRKIDRVLSAPARRRIEALHGRSLLNAFFGDGTKKAREFLSGLRQAFPDRTAFFVDYYGELGRPQAQARPFRLGLVQDLAQIASGQGVPPPNRSAWRQLYNEAGCELAAARDFKSDGIRWFIHEVWLSA